MKETSLRFWLSTNFRTVRQFFEREVIDRVIFRNNIKKTSEKDGKNIEDAYNHSLHGTCMLKHGSSVFQVLKETCTLNFF